MSVIFVVHSPVDGNTITELPVHGDSSIWYLPNDPQGETISLSAESDEDHSLICLEVYSDVVLLRVFGNGECFVLGDAGSKFRVPRSTPEHLKSIILRSDTQFLTSMQHRWEVVWDDETGSKSNSMRAPLPLVSGHLETPSQNDINNDIMKLLVDERGVCTQATEDKSSQSTASPTPPPPEPKAQANIMESDDTNSCSPDDVPASADGAVLTEHSAEEDPRETKAANEKSSRAVQAVLSPAVSELGTAETPSDVVENGHANGDSETDTISCSRDALPTPVSPTLSNDGHKTHEAGITQKKRKLAEIESDSLAGQSQQNDEHASPVTDFANSIRSQGSADPEQRTERRRSARGVRQSPRTPGHPNSDISSSSATTERGSPRKRMRRDSSGSSLATQGVFEPVVVFSGNTVVDQDQNAMAALKLLGGRVTKSINEANMLCVPDGSMKKTSKLIMAVARGIEIVTESWIVETQRSGSFPAVEDFLPNDPSREQLWNFDLKAALQRGKAGLTHLLSGTTVILTKQVRTDLGNLEREISQIATMLGADAVKNRLPALKDKAKYTENDLLIIGTPNDPQGALIGRLGQKLFNKDILTMAVLRGDVERESPEFLLEIPIKDEEEY
ncbi:hypothetical protein LTR10_013482 [Elasticomyces elasticus]|uniref:BRCT domain-containing protein n=1 Tax=Exophiala sideris TaxID=1016849 RepID=A0ABR0JQL3_9EURO|nr:hypothetical protein LTR10_013482 [Elasticomyces elasticus]KAK5039618.1 hypothetical protein LTS07_000112 [Exophiala sideris]KAK5041170.1 hypothetical protein LTR13_002644 [Exophiala sideris]KAK5067995.1 hypothetical protein LTR69_000112 [Exophiala sideris]KAK5187297.1 hypothetical protein LTR44_000112 [Eurotiomycetes sp. CCFEE 6388]